jgi:hypothetical protein
MREAQLRAHRKVKNIKGQTKRWNDHEQKVKHMPLDLGKTLDTCDENQKPYQK